MLQTPPRTPVITQIDEIIYEHKMYYFGSVAIINKQRWIHYKILWKYIYFNVDITFGKLTVPQAPYALSFILGTPGWISFIRCLLLRELVVNFNFICKSGYLVIVYS